MAFLTKQPSRFDKFSFGFVIGLIGPVVGLLLYYLFLFNDYSIARIIEMLQTNANLQSPMLSVALIFNLVMLFLLFRFNLDKAAQGLIAGTLAYAPVILILKYTT